MGRYILRRLIQAIPTMLGITFLSFLLMTAAPGGPTRALAGDPRVTPAQRARLEAQLGINDPWIVQYVHWLIGDDWRGRDIDNDGEIDMMGQRKGILRGDFGVSFVRGRRPVMDIIGELIVPTLELTSAALLTGLVLGIPIGILAALNHGGWFDNSTRIFAVLLNAIPNFWLGLILILTFGSWLQVLPLTGRCPATLTGGCPPLWTWARLQYLILPTITLGTVYVAGYSRYMRTTMLEVISQDYMRTAKAKGLPPRQLWLRHGARNALIPIATFLGPAVAGLIGGAVLTETIFAWPGLGRATILAVQQFDYPLVMATVVISGVATILGYIVSDILYAVIDPRIRF